MIMTSHSTSRIAALCALLLLFTISMYGCSAGNPSQNSSAVSQSNSSAPQSSSSVSQNSSAASQAGSSSGSASQSEQETNPISEEVKKAVDSYEEFVDEYCAFIDNINTADSSALEKLSALIAEELEMTREFEALKDTNLNTEELKYYTEVSLRCTQLLLEYADRITDLNERSANTDDTDTTDEASVGSVSAVRPEVKEAIDSYEAFIDEYCEFMKSYDKNDLSMLTKYMSLYTKEIEMSEEFDKLSEMDLNEKETLYYTEVSLRCSQKILDCMND